MFLLSKLTQADFEAAKRAGAGLTPIVNFDGWWADKTHRIATAKTEAQIQSALNEIKPYAAALWISVERLPFAESIARKRWQELRASSARDVTGDRDA